MAESVPSGIEREGFLRSPDIPRPERMPVTAGKKTAKTGQKPSDALTCDGEEEMPVKLEPIKNEKSENAIAPIMKYWLLRAISADTVETKARMAKVTDPT